MAHIGFIHVPEQTPSAVFPIHIDWGFGITQQPRVITHQFASANRKISQRYVLGTGAQKITVGRSYLNDSDREALLLFWNEQGGAAKPFWLDIPNQAGDETTRYVAYFADPTISFEAINDGLSKFTVTLVVCPDGAPEYEIASTANRFPSASLNDALLEQTQVIFPLISIFPLGSDTPIHVSDRRCTVGGVAYEPRLLDWSGIGQTIGDRGSDEASFTFGNADRVWSQLVNSVDMVKARVEFSLFHAGTKTKLDLWAGDVIDWAQQDGSPEFVLKASDGLYELKLPYPERKILRTCSKIPGLDCPATSCNKTWENCVANNQTAIFGGCLVQAQTVTLKNNATGHWGIGRDKLTSRSLVSDSIVGMPLPEVYNDGELICKKTKATPKPASEWKDGKPTFTYTDIEGPADVPVDALLAAGRDESEFYSALGIVSRGPIADFGDDNYAHTLDGKPRHGDAAHPDMGLRLSYGWDPSTGPVDFFGIDETGKPNGPERAAGVAFAQLRVNDERDIQLRKLSEHTMRVMVRRGLQGYVWHGPGDRQWEVLSNPIWVAVNMLLRSRRIYGGSVELQERYFDVEAALKAAAICDTEVARIVGTGNEKQWTFRGIIRDEKPLRDWIQEVLNCALAYFTFNFGKLKIGMRADSGVMSAFTEGNIVADTLRLSPIKPEFNAMTASFGNMELEGIADSVPFTAVEHVSRIGQELRSNINLPGVSTRSQAARYVVTRVFEELGGVTPEQWAKARQIAFRTTLLALETEPGMIASMTHPEMPGGHGEFRILGWKLNRDFSIDIEGRTTCDEVYQYIAGGNDVDIGPSPVPVETPYNTAPQNIEFVKVEEASGEPDHDGKAHKQLYVHVKKAEGDLNITGFTLHLEAPDFSGLEAQSDDPDILIDPAGEKPLPPDSKRLNIGRYEFRNGSLLEDGSYRFTVDTRVGSPKEKQNWRMYGVSFNRLIENELKPLPAEDHSPTIAFEVHPTEFGLGEEYAPLVRNPISKPEYRFREGAWQARNVIEWEEPTKENTPDRWALHLGTVVEDVYSDQQVKTHAAVPHGANRYVGEWKDCPPAGETEEYDSYMLSVGPGGTNKRGEITPRVHTVIQRPPGTPGEEWCKKVEDFWAKAEYKVTGSGQKIISVDAGWKYPDDPATKGLCLGLWIPGRTEAPGDVLVTVMGQTTAHWETSNLLTEHQEWHIIGRSVDAQNHVNEYVLDVTPEVVIPLDPPNMVSLGDVTGFSIGWRYELDDNGNPYLALYPDFEKPYGDMSWKGIQIWARLTLKDGSFKWLFLGERATTGLSGVIHVSPENFPNEADYPNGQIWDFVPVSVDVNGRAKYDPRDVPFGELISHRETIMSRWDPSPATKFAPLVGGFLLDTTADDMADGIDSYGFEGMVIPNTTDKRYKGCKIVLVERGTTKQEVIATLGAKDTAIVVPQRPKPDRLIVWDAYALSVDANGNTNPIHALTPKVSGLMAEPSPVGKIKMTRFDPDTYDKTVFGPAPDGTFTIKAVPMNGLKPGSFDPNVFKVENGLFTMKFDSTVFDTASGYLKIKAIDVGLLKGTNIKVGNPFGMPSGVTAYKTVNGVSTPVAWFGHNGSIVGMWAKEAYFGGNDPASAKIWTDADGNAHFNGAVTEFSGTIKASQIVGEWLSVGTDVPNMASGIRVYRRVNGQNQMTGFIGSNGSVFGGWFEEFLVGGNMVDPNTAIFRVTRDGKAVFNGQFGANAVYSGYIEASQIKAGVCSAKVKFTSPEIESSNGVQTISLKDGVVSITTSWGYAGKLNNQLFELTSSAADASRVQMTDTGLYIGRRNATKYFQVDVDGLVFYDWYNTPAHTLKQDMATLKGLTWGSNGLICNDSGAKFNLNEAIGGQTIVGRIPIKKQNGTWWGWLPVLA